MVRKRAKFRCEWCGEPATQAHHQIAKGRYRILALDLRNGVALCAKCHMEFHNGNSAPGWEKYRKNRKSDHDYCQKVYREPFKFSADWVVENIKKLEVKDGKDS